MEKVGRIIGAVRGLCAGLAAFLLLGITPAFADTSVGGALSTNMTWTVAGSPYLVTSDVIISSGATLTVDAGVVVRFQAATRLTVQNGALRVPGTAASPVLFTSWRNTAGGSPAAGDWGGVHFQAGTIDSRTLLDHVTVSYGDSTTLAAASPTFNHCSFENNSGYALSIDLASFPRGTGNTATGNGVNAIRVPAGEMTASGAWDLTSIPYYLDGEVSIGAAPRLTGITPADVEQDSSISVTLNGTRLSGAQTVSFTASGLTASILPGASDISLPVQLAVGGAVPLGPVDVTVAAAAGSASLPNGINIIPPVPRITGIVPDRIFINRPATTIDISGRNLTAGTTAYLNGAGLVTTFTSSVLVQAAVPLQAFATMGQLIVKNPDPRAPGSYIDSPASLFTVELPQFTFSPDTLTLHQGDSSSSLNITIPYAAPAGGVTADLSSTNTSVLSVPAAVVIPEGATAAAVTVTALNTGSTGTVLASVRATSVDWTEGTAQVAIRPRLTVNLTPTLTLTGNGWTYYLTVSLTEPAPVSGVTVTLTPSPAGIVTCPATVTIPQGGVSAQVTVTAINPGIATITATAPPPVLSGTTNTATVKAVQTFSVSPIMGRPVGLVVSQPSSSMGNLASYTPVHSTQVGVAVGPVMTGLAPDHGALGANNMTLRINGSGLSSVTAVSFNPSTGITVQNGTLVATDTAVDVQISIADDAPVSQRTVVLGGVTAWPAAPGANLFSVTYQPPQLWSLIPVSATTGSTITLQVNGRNLQQASELAFIPPDGISVGNPPSVSTDGTLASVSITISSNTATGLRAVTITTPGGATPGALSAANTFEVRSTTPPVGSAYANYTPVISSSVGVLVQTPSSAGTTTASYAPVVSLPVGVVSGATIASLSPASGTLGATGLLVRVQGTGLASAASITFIPSTGVTVQNGTLVATDTAVDVQISIADDAPVSQRTVVLGGVTAWPAAPGANLFSVTYQPPQLWSLIPVSATTGSTITLQVNGRNLQQASELAFIPPDGISVGNPPSVSTDGTLASVSITISSNTATGLRAVTITTPGGATPGALSAANTFEVRSTTPPAGSAYANYTPVVSSSVGVLVTTPASTTEQLVTYGPVGSPAVGVAVLTAPTPTTTSVNYAPVISLPVGVTVGSSITGIAPNVIRPGATTDITILGVGLNAVNGVQIQPSSGITIGAITPAPDGLSAIVSVTTATTLPIGAKTVIVSSPSGTIAAAVPGANRLLAGPAPAIVSIEPISQVAGTPFTLTINGTNLQGATEIRFSPADDILVNNPPVYTSDAQGEHLTVSVMTSPTATGGERVVIVSTPYGESDPSATAANTFTVGSLFGWTEPATVKETVITACTTAPPANRGNLIPGTDPRGSGVAISTLSPKRGDQRQTDPVSAAAALDASLSRADRNRVIVALNDRSGQRLFPAYRGPPQGADRSDPSKG